MLSLFDKYVGDRGNECGVYNLLRCSELNCTIGYCTLTTSVQLYFDVITVFSGKKSKI